MLVACVLMSAIQFAQPTAFAGLGEGPTDGNGRPLVVYLRQGGTE
jgi:hypothetical protein